MTNRNPNCILVPNCDVRAMYIEMVYPNDDALHCYFSGFCVWFWETRSDSWSQGHSFSQTWAAVVSRQEDPFRCAKLDFSRIFLPFPAHCHDWDSDDWDLWLSRQIITGYQERWQNVPFLLFLHTVQQIRESIHSLFTDTWVPYTTVFRLYTTKPEKRTLSTFL